MSNPGSLDRKSAKPGTVAAVKGSDSANRLTGKSEILRRVGIERGSVAKSAGREWARELCDFGECKASNRWTWGNKS